MIPTPTIALVRFIKAYTLGNTFDFDNIEWRDVRPTISSATLEFLVKHLRVSPVFIQGLTGSEWRKMGNCHWNRKTSTEFDEAIGSLL